MSEVLAYLAQKDFSYKLRGNEATLNCPFCGDQENKFSIHTEKGVWQCFHLNRCGLKGSLRELKRRLGDIEPIIYKPKTYKRPQAAGSVPTDKLIQWFQKRGISSETVKAFRIRSKNSTIIFPFSKDGHLVNQQYRTFDKRTWQEKNAEQVLFNRDRVPEEMTELVIVEGMIDCMTLDQLGLPNVVSVPSGASNLAWIEGEWGWLDRFDTVYLCLDIDPAGERASLKIAKRLGQWRCRRVRIPFKDPNEWLGKGMTKEMFMEALIRSEDMGPAIVRMAEDFFKELLEEEPEGLKTGFPIFDKILGGLRQREVTVWTGRNGDGKTTILNQLALNFLTCYYEQKVCMASFEMRPAWLLRWMCYQARIILSEGGLKEFAKITDGRLAMIDTQQEISPDELIEAFEYLARRNGMQTFIIDSLLRVNLGGGPDWLEKQRAFMNRLTQFALTYDAHVHLVCHPRKGVSDVAKIDKVDIAGSGDISNLASNVISIRRIQSDKEGDPAAVLEVMKNRQLGRLGAISLAFDGERKRFSEIRR
ncbi:MAG: AAA family ATPase [Planctomycetes bacterium]|nr:AAA family ATPase [Planctomycetota bacterium]